MKALRGFLKCFAKVRNSQHFPCSRCTPGTLTSHPREPHSDEEMDIHTRISDRCRDLSQHVADPGFTQTPPTPGTHVCLMYCRKGHLHKQGPQRAHLQMAVAEGPANHPSLMNYSSPNPKPQWTSKHTKRCCLSQTSWSVYFFPLPKDPTCISTAQRCFLLKSGYFPVGPSEPGHRAVSNLTIC